MTRPRDISNGVAVAIRDAGLHFWLDRAIEYADSQPRKEEKARRRSESA